MARLDRRKFLKIFSSAATTAALSPRFFVGDAYASPTPGRKIVYCFASGGFDGNTVAISTAQPGFIDEFRIKRPNSWQSGPSVGLGSSNYLIHPQLGIVSQMYSQGKAAILDGLGVMQANSASHDIATDDYGLGVNNGTLRTSINKPFTQRIADLYLNSSPWNVVDRRGDRRFTGPAGLSFSNLSGMGFSSGVTNSDYGFMLDTAFSVVEQANVTPDQLPVKESWSEAENAVDEVATAIANTDFNAPYQSFPNTGLGNSFRDTYIALMNYDLKIAWLSFGGHDRHSNLDRPGQDSANPVDQSSLWKQFNDAVTVFFHNLQQAGKDNDVTVVLLTEFGRTVRENATLGTDHGWGTCGLALGGWINGGIYGAPTDLQDLSSTTNRVRAKLSLTDVLADLTNGMGLAGTQQISPQVFPFTHNPSIGLSKPV